MLHARRAADRLVLRLAAAAAADRRLVCLPLQQAARSHKHQQSAAAAPPPASTSDPSMQTPTRPVGRRQAKRMLLLHRQIKVSMQRRQQMLLPLDRRRMRTSASAGSYHPSAATNYGQLWRRAWPWRWRWGSSWKGCQVPKGL